MNEGKEESPGEAQQIMWGVLGMGYVVAVVGALVSIAASAWLGIVVAACVAVFVGFAWVTSGPATRR